MKVDTVIAYRLNPDESLQNIIAVSVEEFPSFADVGYNELARYVEELMPSMTEVRGAAFYIDRYGKWRLRDASSVTQWQLTNEICYIDEDSLGIRALVDGAVFRPFDYRPAVMSLVHRPVFTSKNDDGAGTSVHKIALYYKLNPDYIAVVNGVSASVWKRFES